MEEVLTNDSFSNLTYTKLKRFNKDYWKFVLIMFPTIPISAILPYLGNIYLKIIKIIYLSMEPYFQIIGRL